MTRTISVKGTGCVSAAPDTIEVEFRLKSLNPDYGKTMEAASMQISSIKAALQQIGFAAADLKTTDFRVSSER